MENYSHKYNYVGKQFLFYCVSFFENYIPIFYVYLHIVVLLKHFNRNLHTTAVYENIK